MRQAPAALVFFGSLLAGCGHDAAVADLGVDDGACHVMCDPTLSLADAGVPDGGAVSCAGNLTCKDVFMLFASKWPVGLCL